LFDFLARGLEDLDLHRLPAERALELANSLLRLAQLERRHDVPVRRDRRLAAALDQLLPAPDDRRIDVELATEFRQCEFVAPTRAICSRLNSALKRLRPSDPRRCFCIERSSFALSSYDSQSVSSNWGAEHADMRASAS
jgi:hypothetical protein